MLYVGTVRYSFVYGLDGGWGFTRKIFFDGERLLLETANHVPLGEMMDFNVWLEEWRNHCLRIKVVDFGNSPEATALFVLEDL